MTASILVGKQEVGSLPRRRRHRAPVDEKLIGQRLRELRRHRGDTQAEIAEKIGLTQGLVSAYERGDLRLHGVLLAALAKALHSSPNVILGFEKAKENGILTDRRFLRRLRKIDQLSKREKLVLLGTVDRFLKGSGVS